MHEIIERVAADVRREPWLRIPEQERVDHLPDLLSSLLEDALEAGDEREVPDGVREAARIHGKHRREQHFAIDVLFDEYSILRNQTLRTLWMTHQLREAERLIARVDRSISEATVWSMRGYHDMG